ncbi:MAG TPA: methyltransferase [Burkholderiales bacterium]|nr:methyltransferase [Burkholderiales bacterium]
MLRHLFLLVLFTAFAPGAFAQPTDAAAGLKAAVDGSQRDPANRARDRFRHPLETLAFFGIRDNMTVVEISPGGGWYSEILAPLLRERGHLILAGGMSKALRARVDDKSGLFGKVIPIDFLPPRVDPAQIPNGADRVLTFRNVHNWMAAGTAEATFAAMFRALKPGGILGVVEHRANPAAPRDPAARNGYVHEEQVIAYAQAAGFRLAGKSEINANPADTKDYPQGVWTLPPTLALGATNRDKYLAIGESDRMTLKFVRPREVEATGD